MKFDIRKTSTPGSRDPDKGGRRTYSKVLMLLDTYFVITIEDDLYLHS
jgi:hypothetical protein